MLSIHSVTGSLQTSIFVKRMFANLFFVNPKFVNRKFVNRTFVNRTFVNSNLLTIELPRHQNDNWNNVLITRQPERVACFFFFDDLLSTDVVGSLFIAKVFF